jgi:agmatine deiminase
MRPADLGFSMPAEWAPHAGCWMAWPKRVELWQEHLEAAREDYIRVARAIAAYEPLTMIAAPEHATEAGRRCGPSIRVVSLPIDDSWLRDSAPTFVVDSSGRRAAAAFTFNAWGNKYQPHDQDAALGHRMAALAELPVYGSKLVVEGGGFLSDG